MKIGFIGLGKMGSRIVEKLVREQHTVVAWNRSAQPAEDLAQRLGDSQHLIIAASINELMSQLPAPKIVMLMLPAGEPTESRLKEVEQLAKKNDIVINGANTFYKDTERHAAAFTSKGMRFLGIGISGGIIAIEQGYPLMVGGDASAYEYITPMLDSLAKPGGGHEYFGTGGAGHYVKMVHNGIEYPIMQALGEGFGILSESPYNLDLVKVAKLYQKGTLVSGFMLDRSVEALEDDIVSQVEGEIGSASGEAVWTVDEAKAQNLPAESIELAIDFRRRSTKDPKVKQSFAARMIGALRITFGGHPVKKKGSR